jgi:hypothetical protein
MFRKRHITFLAGAPKCDLYIIANHLRVSKSVSSLIFSVFSVPPVLIAVKSIPLDHSKAVLFSIICIIFDATEVTLIDP